METRADTAPDADGVPAAGDRRRRIGEIFVELGFITSEQLEDALEVQRRTGARIGEILVEQGSMSRLDLASALAEHWEPHHVVPATRPVSLAGSGPGGAGQEEPHAGEHAMLVELERRLRAAERRLDGEQAPSARKGWGLRRRSDVEALAARLETVENGLDALPPLERRAGDATRALEELAAARRADAVAAGARLAAIERRLDDLEATRQAEALALGARLASIERSLEALADLRQADVLAAGARLAGTEDGLAGVQARLDQVEAALPAAAGHDERLTALAAHATELTAQVASLVSRPEPVDPTAQLRELALRIDRVARDGHDRVTAVLQELRAGAAAEAATVEALVEDVRDEARAELGSLAARLDELHALRAGDVGAARAAGADTAALGERLALLETVLAAPPAVKPAKRGKKKRG